MAVISNEELMQHLKAIIGERTDDDAIRLLEDVADTTADYSRRIVESGDWETKYQELDSTWRTRYRDRFYGAEVDKPLPDAGNDVTLLGSAEEPEALTYEDLFTTEQKGE